MADFKKVKFYCTEYENAEVTLLAPLVIAAGARYIGVCFKSMVLRNLPYLAGWSPLFCHNRQ
jgi:hypothetical protein